MIIVTGATRGIGRAIAEKCAQEGQTVLAIARSTKYLREMAADWQRFAPSTLFTLSADLSTAEGCAKLGQFLEQKSLSPQVLVNNVGWYRPGGLLAEEDLLPYFLGINLMAAHRMSRICIPKMLQLPHGLIINIGSVAALDFPPHMHAYTVSKAALHAWHETLSHELSDTAIETSLIVPGATLTSAWSIEEEQPANMLSPQQVANLVWQTIITPPGSRQERTILRP
ncbi:MAG: SDR family oxidoreductase [Bacteroidota bacterium]